MALRGRPKHYLNHPEIIVREIFVDLLAVLHY
jgi:hypothetical protein